MKLLSTKPQQYLAIGLLAIAGTAGLVTITTNASPLQSESVKAALQSDNLDELKNALSSEVKTRSEEKLSKINSLTEADLQNMKQRSANMELIKAKNTEYESKLTDILKADINNKDGFKTTAKEYFESVKTLRQEQKKLRESDPNFDANKHPKMNQEPKEITESMLDKLYSKSVERVKAGKSVQLGGLKMERKH
jgi:G:T-mismatch repair DNA endonuclease (very short patch repair protein)